MPQLIGIALWAIIPAVIAGKKGRNAIGYYFLSFLITPLITTIIVICLKNLKNVPNDVSLQTKIVNEPTLNLREQNKFICKQCGTYHTGWYQKCPTCGAIGKMEKATAQPIPIPSHKQQAIKEQNKIMNFPSTTSFCRYCGEKLPEDSIFCQYCGRKIL